MKIRLYQPDGTALLYTDCRLDAGNPHVFTGLSPSDITRKTRVRVTTSLPYLIEEELETVEPEEPKKRRLRDLIYWKDSTDDILASSPLTYGQ